MRFSAYAPGYFRGASITVRPDGQQHVIVLSKALVVHGMVTDYATGRSIPKFLVELGWPVAAPPVRDNEPPIRSAYATEKTSK